jgi:hypothetical protein
MDPWFSCDLEAEIMSILEEDAAASTRHLCTLLFPTLSWYEARQRMAGVVRSHCRTLVQVRLLAEIDEDLFALIGPASA